MNHLPHTRWLRGAFVAGVLALALAGFSGPATAQEAEPVARTTVRFVHAVPGASNADIRIDGEVVFENVGFGQPTEYISVLPGDREITVLPVAGANDPNADTTTAIDEGSSYIITVLGQVGDVRIKVNEVKLRGVEVGKVLVRLIHASPDSGEIDLAFQGGDTLFDDVVFGEDTKYAEIDAAAYNMEIRWGDDGSSTKTFTLDALTGRVYDLVAVGLAGDQSLTVIIVTTSVSPPCSEILGVGTELDACVRVVNADPDIGPAEVAVAGNVVAQELGFGEATPFVPVTAATDVPVTVSADGLQSADDSPTVSFEAGQAYDVIAWTMADEPVDVSEAVVEIDVYRIDLTSLPADQGRIRLINVGADAGNLDVVNTANSDDPVLIDDVGESNASRYEVVDAGHYEFELRYTGESGSVREAEIDVESGVVYDLVVIGRLASEQSVLLVLTAPAQIRSDTATPAVTQPGATPAG